MENVPPSLNNNRPSQGPVDTSIKIRVVERLFICQLLLGKVGGVDSLAELFARFEVGHPLGRDVDRLARALIAPHTRCPCRHCIAAKAANFYPLSIDQLLSHGIKQYIDS